MAFLPDPSRPASRLPLRVVLPALLLLAAPLASADPITVPVAGPGEVGTPPFIDVPQVCDPVVPVICVGPVHIPLPVTVTVEINDISVTVDPEGTPGATVEPSWHNTTIPVLGITVPIVICPFECHGPATPSVRVDVSFGVTLGP